MQYIKTREQFEELTLAGNVIIQFSATWCGPCKTLTKTMENIIPDQPDVYFYKVDIDSMDKSILQEYNIRSVPRLLMFVNGDEKGEMIGSKSQSEVTEFINNNKEVR
tara:strand:- start:6567 stop:6887 length:321 start_codon:yes stop_codon:yes gene_type:complete